MVYRTGKNNTPKHSFRVSAELWGAAKERARAEGTTLSAVLVTFLEKYVRKSPR